MLEPDVIEQIKKGSEMLGQDLVDKMESNLALFQQFCMATCFNVPPVLPNSDSKLTNSQRANHSAASVEKELDAKLASLRIEIHQVVMEKAKLERDISMLDAELKEHGKQLIRASSE